MSVLDYPLWLRLLHFSNLLFVTLLIRSGLEILSAHPKLYWNDNCTPSSEWIRFGPAARKLPATSRDEEISLPSWVGLPGRKNLGVARHWHFLCDAGWLVTGILYYVLLFATGEWRRLIPESWSIIPQAWHAFGQYATFHLVEAAGGYNALQQVAYASIVFVIAPLTIATGVAMSPSITARFPWYLSIFHGRQSARSLHFLCVLAFSAFLAMHVAMVIAHGFGHELALIVLGQTAHQDVELALIVGWAGLAAVVIVHVAATVVSLRHPRFVQDTIGSLIDGMRRAMFGHSVSRQHYTRAEVAPYFRVNGRPPVDSMYRSLAAARFAEYQLDVNGLVQHPLRFSMDDLRRMPKQTQVTKHCCIQGWSAVAEWSGVRLRDIVDRVQPLPAAHFIAFYAFDNKPETEPDADGPGHYYGTIHLDLARDPQTILAYDMNGQPLPIPHGAPLRLRVETQLGFMMVKYVQRIEFVRDYRHVGLGEGGWREDYQFYSPEAGI